MQLGLALYEKAMGDRQWIMRAEFGLFQYRLIECIMIDLAPALEIDKLRLNLLNLRINLIEGLGV